RPAAPTEAPRARRPGAAAGSEPVDEDKEAEPDDVDEVPVPGDRLECEVPLRREMTSHHAQPDDEQHDRAEHDVHAVEAGQHEERRAVNAGRIEPQTEILIRVDIFLGLEAEEEEAEKEGRG